MFLSCVFHVSHVAMDVKLFLQIKALETPDLGFHHCGRQWPAFQECGSWVLVPWASFGRLSFMHTLKEGVGDAAQSGGQACQTLALEIRE